MKKWVVAFFVLLILLFIVFASYKLGLKECESELESKAEKNLIGQTTEDLRQEIVIKSKMTPYSVEIVKVKDSKSDDCKLLLLAKSYGSNFSIDISHPYYKCSLFMNVTVLGYYDYRSKNSFVFIESAYGGDGEHTPPILKVFKINKSGIVRVGEVELVNVSYIKKNQIIDHILAEEIIDFCYVCDGWDAAEEGSVFFIPVEITIGCDGLCKRVKLTESEKKKMIDEMKKYKNEINQLPKSDSRKDDLERIAKSIRYVEELFNQPK